MIELRMYVMKRTLLFMLMIQFNHIVRAIFYNSNY